MPIPLHGWSILSLLNFHCRWRNGSMNFFLHLINFGLLDLNHKGVYWEYLCDTSSVVLEDYLLALRAIDSDLIDCNPENNNLLGLDSCKLHDLAWLHKSSDFRGSSPFGKFISLNSLLAWLMHTSCPWFLRR